MGSICQNMVGTFQGHNGRHDEAGEEIYSDMNLEAGIVYASGLRADGYKTCPINGYDLAAFEAWCWRQLAS